jgi:hypothetical protein
MMRMGSGAFYLSAVTHEICSSAMKQPAEGPDFRPRYGRCRLRSLAKLDETVDQSSHRVQRAVPLKFSATPGSLSAPPPRHRIDSAAPPPLHEQSPVLRTYITHGCTAPTPSAASYALPFYPMHPVDTAACPAIQASHVYRRRRWRQLTLERSTENTRRCRLRGVRKNLASGVWRLAPSWKCLSMMRLCR